ncbi:M20 metallopeptidase family protein [Streptomyces violascens]|uniref:N-acyl-L-amino acid amidohydrolase n=1 Tax=Streptomyces violascens TaxID=67381 RepID=A0ABQ3QU27_9ACTN|nr:amidohydrolase [Streptomyces violascens]GGU06765.1 N-acyl-L-amino acid amidohydrolase [Streptomyces violascens]GHI40794.1 N-acyl-L-amino acid amidohydrolase [Streptomyces violascens]
MVKHPKEHALARRTVLAIGAGAGAGMVWGTAGRAAADGFRGPREQRAVDAEVARLERGLIELRRDIHRHPERPGQEQRTAAVVATELRAAGLEVTAGVGGNGVVAVLRGSRPGRTVAYRADMDAVPPKDIVGGGPAAAHLCGHDIHTTVAIGVAKVLMRLRRQLSGTVVFLFQPAEEALTGARAVIDAGVLERTRAEEIHALHCGPFPVGQFAVTSGFGLPGQDRAEVTVTGPGAPDAARRLAAEIGALATVAPPQTPADIERMIADAQIPHGPLARFVALRAGAQEAKVGVSYRCWPQERYEEVREDIRRLASSYPGAEVAFPSDPFPAMVCPEGDGDRLARHLRRTLGRGAVNVLHSAFPPFSGEDFALYLDRIPGTFTFLGVHAPGAPITTAYPHYPDFTPDERAIGVGVRAMAGWLAERTDRPGV